MFGEKVSMPMTAPTKLRLTLHKIQRGIERRKKETKRWKMNREMVRGRQWLNDKGTETRRGSGDEVTVNKLGAFMRDHCAAIAFNAPRVALRPVNAAGWERIQVPMIDPETGPVMEQVQVGQDPATGAPIMGEQPKAHSIARYKVRENLLNHILGLHDFGMKDTIRRVGRSGQIAYGVFKSGYTPDYEDDSDDGTEIPVGEDGELDFSGFRRDENGELIEEDGELVPKDAGPIRESWFIEYVKPDHMIIDPDGDGNFYNHSWVCQEMVVPLAEVKSNKNYKNTEDLKFTCKAGMSYEEGHDYPDGIQSQDHESDDEIEEADEAIRLFEFWDLDADELLVLADGHDKFLRDGPTPDNVPHSPYEFFRPQEIDGEFYQRPPLSDGVPIAVEINMYRTCRMRGALKSSDRKTMGLEGKLDPKDQNKLIARGDHHIIVKSSTLEGAVAPVPFPPLSPEVYNYGQELERSWNEQMGQSPESQGNPASKTATQSQIMEGHGNIRVNDQRALLKEAIRGAVIKLNKSLDNMTTEQAVSILGGDGMLFQRAVTPEDIACECDVDVEITDMMPTSREQEDGKFINGLTMAAQAPWLLMERKAAEVICGKMGIKDQAAIDALVKAANDMMKMTNPPPTQPGTQPPKGNAAPRNPGEARSQQGRAG